MFKFISQCDVKGVKEAYLLASRDLARAYSPDGFVGNDNLAPIRDLLPDGSKLTLDNSQSLAALTFLESFANTQDHAKSSRERRLGLVRDQRVRIAKQGAPLRVAEDDPGDSGIYELSCGDLASECTRRSGVAVLRCDLDVGLDCCKGSEEVERRRGNHDLWNIVLDHLTRLLSL